MEGESSVDGDFLINGTILPLVIQQAPFQSMYLLTISTGNVSYSNDTKDITFNLNALVCSTGFIAMPMSNVTLRKIGGKTLLIFACFLPGYKNCSKYFADIKSFVHVRM